jgi:uncharacterized membrane protein
VGSLFEGPLGAFHTVAASIALIVGFINLCSPKGTRRHKLVGYVFVASMLALNLSAIPIQRMYGGFGPFHVFILISLPTVLAAIYYPVLGRSNPKWLQRHLGFMYWSYVGLVAAFVNEIVVRAPLLLAGHPSSTAVSTEASSYVLTAAFLATGAVMGIAEYIFRSYRRQVVG